MKIIINKNKIVVNDETDNYEFDFAEIMKFAMIVNDNSRKGKIYRLVANYLYENDMKIGNLVEIKKNKGENNG